MFKFESGKVKLKPNQISLVKFKKGRFNKKPTLNTTSIENKSITIHSVKSDHFIISNDSSENVIVHYTAMQNKNDVLVETPISFYLNATNYSTTINTTDINQLIVFLDLNNQVETNEGNTVIFEAVDDQSINSFESISIDEDGNLSLNTEVFSNTYDPLNFDVIASLQEDNTITATINLNFDFVSPLYETIQDSNINNTSNSSLTSLRQHNITYTADAADSISGFFTPSLSLNNEENYFKINADISSSPSMVLFVAGFNNSLVYNTTDPENPTENRTLEGQIYSYTSGFSLVDQTAYYFWYDENDVCWYYNEDRFPLG